MADELTPEEQAAENAITEECLLWAEMGVSPPNAIAVDGIVLNSKFHALVDLLEETKVIDRAKFEVLWRKHFLGILQENRAIVAEKIQEARMRAIMGGMPRMDVPKKLL